MSDNGYYDICLTYKGNTSVSRIIYAEKLSDALVKGVNESLAADGDLCDISVTLSEYGDDYAGYGY
jgi:hypothetical protein